MDWLNYHHLHYFWVVAREGTIAAASRSLRLAPSTISEQVSRLEESFGQELFRRSGRNNVLTDAGQVVFRYADEIFRLGRELQDYVKGRAVERLHLHVGLSMVVPKQVATRLMMPVLEMESPRVHLVCREGPTEDLLAELALHHLDVVITDAPLGPDTRIRAFNHMLAECGVEFLATPEIASSVTEPFPKCLDGMPMLLPTTETVVRRLLDHFFDDHDIHPNIVGEFDDSALMKVFGQHGKGAFPAPSMVSAEIQRQYGVEQLGVVPDVQEQFYAVSVQRQLRHPAVRVLAEAAPGKS